MRGERDADGRRRECRRVVGAIADHQDAAALGLERTHCVDFAARQQVSACLGDPECGRNGCHVLGVVATEQHRAGETEGVQSLDEGREIVAHTVGEGDHAGAEPVDGDVGAKPATVPGRSRVEGRPLVRMQ